MEKYNQEKYNLIKTELDNILNSDEIIYDGKTISAYELKNIITDEFRDMYDIYSKKAIKDINEKNANLINKITNRKIKEINIYTDSERNWQKINFIITCESFISTSFHSFSICKKTQKDKVFFEFIPSDDVPKKFLKENFEYIINILNKMEYYNTYFGINFGNLYMKSHLLNQNFNYGIFNIRYILSSKPKLTITPINYELNSLFNLTWLTKECLSTYTHKNIDELTKRIPIKIDELNPLLKKIVNLSLPKHKTLQLKK